MSTVLISGQLRMKLTILMDVLNHLDMAFIKWDKNGWPKPTQTNCTLLVQTGVSRFQRQDGPFVATNGCSMTTQWFQKRLLNGQLVKRSWLLSSDEVLEDVLGLEDVLEDRFVKSLALASTVLSLALASALLGLGFCAVLGSRTRYF